MKYFSTFSGIGGFELGIELAYETIRDFNVQTKRGGQAIKEGELQADGERLHTISSETTLHPKNGNNEYPNGSVNQRQPHCVGYSEIDKYATQIYQKHFPYEQCERCRIKNEGQGVQGIGDTEGFNSERNNISTIGLTCSCRHKNYGDITKIVAEELPDFDLLVGGFPCQAFSIAGKRGGFEDTRGTMFFELARILRAKQPRLFVFENVKGLLSHDGGKSFATIIQTLDELGYDLQWQVLNSKNHGVPQNRERVFIIGHLRGTPRPQVFPFFGQSNENTTVGESTKTAVARTLTGGGHTGGNHSGMTVISRTVRSGGRSSPHGSKQNWDSYEFEGQIRRLTPLECERLQGFPDGWTQGVSDTQRYKCCGNAVTVNVIRDIFEKIL